MPETAWSLRNIEDNLSFRLEQLSVELGKVGIDPRVLALHSFC